MRVAGSTLGVLARRPEAAAPIDTPTSAVARRGPRPPEAARARRCKATRPRLPRAAGRAAGLAAVFGLHPFTAAALEFGVEPTELIAKLIDVKYFLSLASGALININISNDWPANGTVLIVVTSKQREEWRRMGNRFFMPNGNLNSYLVSAYRQPFHSNIAVEIKAPATDRYHVAVMNVRGERLRLHGRIAFVNPGGQHLPLRDAHLPAILWASGWTFLALGIGAALLCTTLWRRQSSSLHAFLTLCICLKALERLLNSRFQSFLAREGGQPRGWQFEGVRLARHLQEIAEILFLLLTALGWRVLRSRLTWTETRCILMAMGMAVFLAFMQASHGGSNRYLEMRFSLFFQVVKVLSYLVVIFALNFNLQLITVRLVDDPVTPGTAMVYEKLQAYLNFRFFFVAIVCAPSVLIWLDVCVVSTEETEWVIQALKEAAEWAISAGLLLTLPPGRSQRNLRKLLGETTGPSAMLDPDSVAPIPDETGGLAEPEGMMIDEGLEDADLGEAAAVVPPSGRGFPGSLLPGPDPIVPAEVLPGAVDEEEGEDARRSDSAPYVPLAGGE